MTTGLMWFRRDLRLNDNAALFHALSRHGPVYACFCFDTEILDKLKDRTDRRVEFIRQCVAQLDDQLKQRGSRIIVRHGPASIEIPKLAAVLGVDAVYANHDYEPQRLQRDRRVGRTLAMDGRVLKTFKDHVIFERDEVVSAAGHPFRVYTPYRNAWLAKLSESGVTPYSCDRYYRKLAPPPRGGKSHAWSPNALGFQSVDIACNGGAKAGRTAFDEFLTRIDDYPTARDIPACRGTSDMSVHLRYGTVSIRELVIDALAHGSAGARKWIDELIWREFHNMVLHQWPHIATRSFHEKYEDLNWRRDRRDFAAWCAGRTGFSIVDAAMRQLNATGQMHNRLRMVAASFLTKDLRINWRWGERYFAEKLLDYDMSQNVGNWQWCASIGTDAQPYFRVFNPVVQSQKFDPDGEFIRRYIPALAPFPAELIHEPHKAGESDQRKFGCVIGKDYPAPMVNHATARLKAIAMFKRIKVRAIKTNRS